VADQGQWFKLWVGADDDPDLGNLSNEDFGRWCKLGTYLKKHGTNGQITMPAPAIPLQNRFRVVTYKDVLNVLKLFPNCVTEEMHNSSVSGETTLTVTWCNWSKYQGDFSTARVRKMRQMKRSKRRGEEKRGEETKKRREMPSPHNSEWLETLKTKPAYQGIDIERELSKCLAWFETKNVEVSRQRFLGWLNRAERRLTTPPPTNPDHYRDKSGTLRIKRTDQEIDERTGRVRLFV